MKLPLSVSVWRSVTGDGDSASAATDGATLTAFTVVPPLTESPPPSVTMTASEYLPVSAYVCFGLVVVKPAVRATLSVDPSPQLIATVCVSSASVSVKLTERVVAPPSATALAASVRSAGAWLLGRTTRLALELPAPLSRSVTVTLTVTGPAAPYECVDENERAPPTREAVDDVLSPQSRVSVDVSAVPGSVKSPPTGSS